MNDQRTLYARRCSVFRYATEPSAIATRAINSTLRGVAKRENKTFYAV